MSDAAWSQPSPPGAVDYYMRQKKMNVVRLNFPWEFVQPELMGPLDRKNANLIQQQVNRVTGAGAYIILEFHNYNRRKVDGIERIIGEHPSLTSEHFSDAWRKMAVRWKDNERVIFELMNEPHDCDTATLVRVSNDAIAAIRAEGAENLIMLCGNDWNSMGWREGSDNQTHMLDIVDPLDHFCFDVHHYFDEWSQGKTHSVRRDPIASMVSFTNWAKTHGKKGFCGEFGCAVNKRGMDACRDLLAHIEENPDVYIGWAWWGGGGPWQPDYEFLLDPFASHTSPNNPDPKGSVTWRNPVDRPQMKLLQKYLPADATPFNAWLIEDQLFDSIEAMYRHGDFIWEKRMGALSDTQPWRQFQALQWLGTTPGIPADPEDRNYIWEDSGPNKKDAITLSSDPPYEKPSVSSDDQGGVALPKTGTFLLSQASLAGNRVYAMVAANADISDGASSTVLAVDDGKGNATYRLTVSGAEMKRAVEKTKGNRPTDTNGKSEKLFVEALPVGTSDGASKTWSLRLNTEDAGDFTSADANDGLLVIGAANIAGFDGLGGLMYNLVIMSNDISDEDDRRVQGRLYWDLGIANRLPDEHPYRYRAPSVN